ncbi:Nif11-like leader peptide family natural product precursor [Brasilonema octagenarum]|uniref:Nif11-like leader peptide family natural product n=1 Tax=Brasilonema octagenarum UFV-OR1 TaxID=417115 RepID=A0ABX1M003_9CYAN|nr:Nif11-like leader peptide family natural product precursor [Brasilonema octagenarum]NMF61802.1 Nif11-like leader peptide family natural product precursor [Brasilonema octagenarum UFV-OR1]
MSLEDVKAFYQRLGTDEAFRTQIQGVDSKDQCSQTVKSAGYDFTQEELQEYTAELLELAADEDELADLDEKELATVFGGFIAQPLYGVIYEPPIGRPPIKPPIKWPPIKPPIAQPLYGVVQPLYGVIRPADEI